MSKPTQEELRKTLKGKDYRDYLEEWKGKKFADKTFKKRKLAQLHYDREYERIVLGLA